MMTMREKIESEGTEYEFGGEIGHKWVMAQAGDWVVALKVFDGNHIIYNDGIGDSDIDADADWERTRTDILEVLGYLRESTEDTGLADDLIDQITAIS
jgi:hypothetical protein